MAKQITQAMLVPITRGATADLNSLRIFRQLLALAGVAEEYELHEVEIAAMLDYREKERSAREWVRRYRALGPVPPCSCDVDQETGLILSTNGCRRGDSAGRPPIDLGVDEVECTP